MMVNSLNNVSFVSVETMMKLINLIGVEKFITNLSTYIKEDFMRWNKFDKTSRIAAHSVDGVIELMPISDDINYAFKYVNGHPSNGRTSRQTVTAFGVLSDVNNGYPILLSEMTLLTALRTAATSALAAHYLAPNNAKTMAIIGNGAQAEFQAIAFKAMLGITNIQLFDIDDKASVKCARNLEKFDLKVKIHNAIEKAIEGSEVITTVTADKKNATILTDNHIGPGVHINGVGGDCPGKTEIHPDVLHRSRIIVEYEPQTRIEGEIQQLSKSHPVVELWKIISSLQKGRFNQQEITLFDSVGFAIEDFSALRYVNDCMKNFGIDEKIDLLADPDDPRDLFGMILRNKAKNEYRDEQSMRGQTS